MGTLLTYILRYVGRILLTLVVIIIVLLTVKVARGEWDLLAKQEQDLMQLADTERTVNQFRDKTVIEFKRRIPNQDAPFDLIKKHLANLESDLIEKKSERKSLWDANPLSRRLPASTAFRRILELDIEIALLQEAVDYSKRLHDFARGPADIRKDLGNLRLTISILKKNLDQNRDDQLSLRQVHPIAWRMPSTTANDRLKGLEKSQSSLMAQIKYHQKSAESKQNSLDLLERRGPMSPFSIDQNKVSQPLAQLRQEISEIEKSLNASTIRKILRPVLDALPMALSILAGVLLFPLLFKTLAFYVIAPIAARMPGIRLLPETTGLITASTGLLPNEMIGSRSSSVSIALPLNQESSLLIRPEYLQAVSSTAQTKTKWLLDWGMPLSSLATGMYGLIKISPQDNDRVTISSTSDPLVEFSVINIPAGCALVLKPRFLVGIVQIGNERLRITRHWRIGSLSAWSTLRLRHVAFHGPAQLIVKGCRGVRVEPVAIGRSVTQAATLGFSANLRYSVARNATFPSYLFGQRELFMDSWSGENGCCIYAEAAYSEMRPSGFGKRIEGVIDALLKSFGL